LTSGRPDDSNEEIIRQRIKNYNDTAEEIKKYYFDKIVEIDGEGTPDEVYKRVIDILFETVIEPKDINDII
jgi:adenylate kinase